MSRAAGVLLYNLPYMEMFLNENPHINNKLACLVRSEDNNAELCDCGCQYDS